MATTKTKPDVEPDIDPFAASEDEPDDDEGGDGADISALFDRSQYEREELQIAKVDGNPIDRIAITFSGQVFLDRSAPADVALFNKLRLGKDVTLMVEAKCSTTAAKGATDKEGDLDVVVGQKTAKVHTVYVPLLADELVAAA